MALGSHLDRRQFLHTGLLAAAAVLTEKSAMGAGLKMPEGTIDVHHHFFPAVFDESNRRFLTAVYGAVPDYVQNWSPEHDLEIMDRNGIAKAVLCTSARTLGKDITASTFRDQARQANDFGARMVQDHPKRYAQFGFMPMPDVEGTLREIEYCLDTLKAPGIGLMTSYGNRWQGHPDFVPVLEELNRRKAVVFCHPLPAACCTNLMPETASRESQLVEFPYDTGRAVVSLLMSGSFVKYRDIQWIWSHCGDTVPVLEGRMKNVLAGMNQEQVAKFAPHGLDYELQRMFYDSADAAYAPSMAAFRAYIPPTQLMFGTDFPYVPVDLNVREIYARHLPAADFSAMSRRNAIRLMPSLAS